MSGIPIERGLKLIDAADVGERGLGTRPSLTNADDRLREIAVWIASLNGGHDYEPNQQRGCQPSTPCAGSQADHKLSMSGPTARVAAYHHGSWDAAYGL